MATCSICKRHLKRDDPTHCVGVESGGNSEAAISAEVVGEELLDVHNGGEVFATEPPLTLAAVGEALAEVAGVAARGVRAGAVVHEQAVSIEGLRECDGGKLAVGLQTDGHG